MLTSFRTKGILIAARLGPRGLATTSTQEIERYLAASAKIAKKSDDMKSEPDFQSSPIEDLDPELPHQEFIQAKTTPQSDHEPEFIPHEDLEAELAERKAKRLQVKKQYDEDAKHWTYPISYASEEEISYRTHKNKAARFKAFKKSDGSSSGREFEYIPKEDLELEAEHRREEKRIKEEKEKEIFEDSWTYPVNYPTVVQIKHKRTAKD